MVYGILFSEFRVVFFFFSNVAKHMNSDGGLEDKWYLCIASVSVADQDPQDPYVFGPPGSGSGSFNISKNSKKNLLYVFHKCKWSFKK